MATQLFLNNLLLTAQLFRWNKSTCYNYIV